MGRLFIAEKPSVAKAIASELGSANRSDGYISCGDDIVCWAFGHMLETAAPDEYTSDDIPRSGKGNKIWRAEDLPIIPKQWIHRPKKTARKQLKVIQNLLDTESLDIVVNAGDPDREGQLLVDEILDYYKCKKAIKRFWVSAQDPVSIRRGLAQLRDNSEFKGWADAARARTYADWLVGMNLSRAYTLANQRSGSRMLCVVGRVQSPTLALIVDRDRQIEQFVSKPYYQIIASLAHENGDFFAKWIPAKDQQGLDSEGRLIDKAIAESIVARTNASRGVITDFTQKKKSQAHPLAFSLAELTLLASNLYGFTAEKVLNVCQALYETHKLVSYPRTDSGFLPEAQFGDVPAVMDALLTTAPEYSKQIKNADTNFKSRVWSDKGVTAHHGMIPTQHRGDISQLDITERQIYEMIVKRYLAQFYPLHRYLQTTIKANVENETFAATGKVVIDLGWRAVLSAGHSDKEQALPSVEVNDSVNCVEVNLNTSKTKAPPRFTEGTLIQAMQNIHKYISDPTQKKALREGDGIGTSATRDSIIKELKRRKYVGTKGKFLISSELARSMIDAYPDLLKSAVMTAANERHLKTIEQTAEGYESFMREQEQFIRDQVVTVRSLQLSINDGQVDKSTSTRKSSRSKGKFRCADCDSDLIRRPGKTKGKYWWGCSSFPRCKTSYRDISGKPHILSKSA